LWRESLSQQRVFTLFPAHHIARNTLCEFHSCTKVLGLTAPLIPRRFVLTLNQNPVSENFQAGGRTPRCSLPQKGDAVRKTESEWRVYRTRFLIRAKQLTGPLEFRDALGREHRGQGGDYLVESSDGTQRIAPREIFEDVYVAMGAAIEKASLLAKRDFSISDLKRRSSARAEMPA
jgi:hypothetical protein